MAVKIRHEELHRFISELFNKAGVPKDDAELVAEVLVKADRRGISSHGVSRIPIYIERIERDLVIPDAEITVIKESPSTALLDGGYGLGQIVGVKAMQVAIDKANETGVGIVSINKSHHFGIAAHYAEMAIEEGMIGIACSNTTALMAPPGGASKAIGNNPFAFAFPSGSQLPVIFDAACSAVAQGKIIVANINGKSIPEGWAIDKDGKPTTDPAEALKGFLLPAAGTKGYGLAVIIESLAGVLSGAQVAKNLPSIYNDLENRQNCGHFFAAIKIDNFDDLDEFKNRMDDFIIDMKSGKKAIDNDEIFLPGEIELKKEMIADIHGVIIEENNYNLLQEVGQKYGVELNVNE